MSHTIEEDNLSVAWARAFLSLMETSEIAPLTVVIRGFDCGEPMEVAPIRKLLDDALAADDKPLSCNKVANTIFPISLWNPEADRQQLYERYRRIMPNVLKYRRNWHGVYFQRLIAFGHRSAYEGDDVNQLEHIIQTWHRGNHRRSALHAAIFDPYKDPHPSAHEGLPLPPAGSVRSGKARMDWRSPASMPPSTSLNVRTATIWGCVGLAVSWPRRWGSS